MYAGADLSPLDARLLNLVLGTGFDPAAAAASGSSIVVAAGAGASAEPRAAAVASPDDVRAPADSDARLGVAVAPVPVPPESCEPGLFLAASAVPGLFLVVDLAGMYLVISEQIGIGFRRREKLLTRLQCDLSCCLWGCAMCNQWNKTGTFIGIPFRRLKVLPVVFFVLYTRIKHWRYFLHVDHHRERRGGHRIRRP